MIGGAKGIGIGIDFGIPNQYCRATSKPYIEKDVLDSLRVVASAYGKSNDDADRSIVKNLVDASNPFIISNAAFKLNSGFGKYETELSDTRIWTKSKDATPSPFSSSYNGLSGWIIFANTELTNSVDIPSIKIEVKGLLEGQELIYRYYDSTGQTNVYSMTKDGEYTLPADVRTAKTLTSNTSGFQIVKNETNTITITQIPSFEGAFVTDGIDDLITSTKTVQEMLGGSTEFTAVSMIHLISPGQDVDGAAYTNYIRTSDNYWTSNRVSNVGKTGIYGYSFKQSTPTVINNILGDKGDYTTDKSPDTSEMFRANFSVEGFEHAISGTVHASSVAWYWTIIANKVLTTDQINQVIAYFNLDRTLNPDILCNTIKQGITNENHAEFGDKLIDFSGNGRDIQLNNIAWKGDSGIGKYEVDFLDSSIWDSSNSTITSSKIDCKNAISHIMLLYYSVGSKEYPDIPSFKVIKTGADIDYSYIDETGSPKSVRIVDGVNVLPASHNTLYSGSGRFCGFGNPGMGNSVTITQIPSHAGGLCLDGINDFGKVTGMPIYKDYTVIADYERFYLEPITGGRASILSKSSKVGDGSFIFNLEDQDGGKACYTFGGANGNISDDITRIIRYQSKYYNTKTLSIGTAEDNDFMVLGKVREVDSRHFCGAIYSLMSFPYSMSEFLIERQLKKHKLGTLYPDMVEFRPIVKSNVKWNIIEIWQKDKSLYRPTINDNKTGIYLKKDSTINIYVKPKDADEVTKIVVNGTEYTNLKINSDGFYYATLPITKSPQKINITVDEYIRFEDIVQPYPSFVKLENLDGTHTYTWGDKLKVGDIIRYNSSKKLLEGAYTLRGQMECNGVYVFDNNQQIVVTKEMVFAWSHSPIWNIDDNEPKCILSPRLLRIPNSSYKILGYIPDISGHGNHGVIHNSAYAEGSGVNEDGSYQFDGVDDFVTIPTTVGGKQVLMKVNWDDVIANAIIYDQRGYPNEFAICNADKDNSNNPVFAYQARNTGQTYIDGILNSNIKASELKAITHNITITNELSAGVNKSSPVIGSNIVHNDFFVNMALYDFMLFDEISTDDKIQELNEYVGVEAKVELPPYYWDNYGKTNLDEDRDIIQQRGIAVGDYDLTNYNHAYEGMSGYNGYPVVFGANKTWANESNGYVTSITSNTIHITNVLNAGLALLYSYVKYKGNLQNIKEIPPFKIEIKGLEGRSRFIYKYLATSDATKETNLYLGNGTHELPKSFLPTEAIVNDAVVGFSISPIEEGVTNFLSDITIEVLPKYENGLVYDGLEDYSVNTNIPALTDYTYICKRTILNIPSNGATLLKGAHKTNGGAFIADYNNKWQFNFGQYNIIQSIPDGINWQTSSSFNGTSINRGTNTDDKGITIGRFSNGYANMVLYKLILYPKTIPLLQINFLKNLMERDEIIDLNNPIFIQ